MAVDITLKDGKSVSITDGKKYAVEFIPGEVTNGSSITKTGTFRGLSMSQYFLFLEVPNEDGTTGVTKFTIPTKEVVKINDLNE